MQEDRASSDETPIIEDKGKEGSQAESDVVQEEDVKGLNWMTELKRIASDGSNYVNLLTAYLSVAIFNMVNIKMKASDLVFASQINPLFEGLLFAFFLLAFTILKRVFKNENGVYHLMNAVVFAFGLLLITECQKDIFLTLGVTVIVGYIIYNTQGKLISSQVEATVHRDYTLVVVIFGFIAMSSLIALATIYRLKTYYAPTFDFGIFAQMYEYLASTGLPYTTVERNQLLSHFAIHFSPIFYLLLPGYYLFRAPEYLLVMQAVLICSGVFPVYVLSRHFNLGKLNAAFISLGYLIYPGVVMPAFFDFHENKFLTVFLLWTFAFYEKKRYSLMAISMVLVLLVKEEAALYILFFGLYCLLAKKDFKRGMMISLLGFTYFIAVTTLLSRYGHGIMDNRYQVYQLAGESGLWVVIKNSIANPVYFVMNLFSPDKFKFVLYLFAPLLFVPLITPKWQSLILLTPIVLVNLMTAYPYQYDIGFQYTYGVSAILFYLFLTNMTQFGEKTKRLIAIMVLFASFAFLLTAANDKFTIYQEVYKNNEVAFSQTALVLSKVPVDASVTADTFFTAHLYKVKELYDFPSNKMTDYLVLDARMEAGRTAERGNEVSKEGYELFLSGGHALVYKRIDVK